MTIDWQNWRGAVEGYEPSIQAAAASLVDHGMASQDRAEEIARHVLWIAGVDHLWQHAMALRAGSVAADAEDLAKLSAGAEAAFELWNITHNADVDAPLPSFKCAFTAGFSAALVPASAAPQATEEPIDLTQQKIVPLEPTEAMLKAGQRAADDKTWAWRGFGARPEGTGIDGQTVFVREAYRAMISAAPSTPNDEATDEPPIHSSTPNDE